MLPYPNRSARRSRGGCAVETTKFVAVVVWVKDAARLGPVLTGEWLDSVGALVSSYWRDMSGGRQNIMSARA